MACRKCRPRRRRKKTFHIPRRHRLGGENGKEIVTAGGRVLCVTALADSVKVAQRRAYEIADQIHFDGCQLRHDIGYRAINHPRK